MDCRQLNSSQYRHPDYGQLEAGKDQEAALKTQAEEERVAAESRELERQQKLNKALAANAVGMGM